jgi:hypothetical protein
MGLAGRRIGATPSHWSACRDYHCNCSSGSQGPIWRGEWGWWGGGVGARARLRTRVAWAGPIPSPSSRQPHKRVGRGRVKRHDLPPLDPNRMVCSADGPDDGDPGRGQARKLFPHPRTRGPRRRHRPLLPGTRAVRLSWALGCWRGHRGGASSLSWPGPASLSTRGGAPAGTGQGSRSSTSSHERTSLNKKILRGWAGRRRLASWRLDRQGCSRGAQ